MTRSARHAPARTTLAQPIRSAAPRAFSRPFPSLSVTASIDETSRPTFLRSGVTSLLEASAGRWLSFLIESVPRRSMATSGPSWRAICQIRTFTLRAPLHKNTVELLALGHSQGQPGGQQCECVG